MSKMAEDKNENTFDPETLLQTNNASLDSTRLRRFACECCRRISFLCKDPAYQKLLEFADERISKSISMTQLTELRSEATRLYDKLYPGYGSPSATALALSAAGEAAFTESPLKSAINASQTAAMAVAVSAAATADDSSYDAVHETTYKSERKAQYELLMRM
jgi:hypothetical protein